MLLVEAEMKEDMNKIKVAKVEFYAQDATEF
jgi:hypothetical protein